VNKKRRKRREGNLQDPLRKQKTTSFRYYSSILGLCVGLVCLMIRVDYT
jgi:hypothetical protein